MSNLKGKRVVLTGAGGGIGRCVAREFAQAGAELILSDLNEAALKGVAEELRQRYGAKILIRVVDISKREEVEAFAKWAVKTCGGIDILINNAGIGHSGELIETTLETWKKLFDVNFWGALYHVYAFLPSMIQQKQGHIVNVSSGQAFFRLPTWGAYTTVKLALGGFSEILSFELRKLNIAVTTFYPFMVETGFYEGIEGETTAQRLAMRFRPYYSMSPEKVARILFKAVERKKPSRW